MGITVFPTPTSSSGGGYNQVLPTIQMGNVVTNSTATCLWTPVYSGCVAFHVIGGGGCGADSFCGGGGGSGGYARKVLDITTDQCFCIKVGGSNASTCVCNVTASPSINIIAYPGCNGSGNNGGNGACCPTGGDVNRCGLPGGDGGSSSNIYAGGAAVDIWGLGLGCGGSAQGSQEGAAGGGGIGGQGGCVYNATSAQYPRAGGGGGSGGQGSCHNYDNIICKSHAHGGPSALAVPPGEEKFWSFVPYWGKGGSNHWMCADGSSSWRMFSMEDPGPGGGGAGGGAENKMAGQNGDIFGGGGGGLPGGNGGCGAGGGGGRCQNQQYGIGGSGVVFIEYLSVTT